MYSLPTFKVHLYRKDKIVVREEQKVVLEYDEIFENFFIPALRRVNAYIEELSDFYFVAPRWVRVAFLDKSRRLYFKSKKDWLDKTFSFFARQKRFNNYKFILDSKEKSFSVKEFLFESLYTVRYLINPKEDISATRIYPLAIVKVLPMKKRALNTFLSQPHLLKEAIETNLSNYFPFAGNKEILKRLSSSNPYLLLTKTLLITKNGQIFAHKAHRSIESEIELSFSLESYF